MTLRSFVFVLILSIIACDVPTHPKDENPNMALDSIRIYFCNESDPAKTCGELKRGRDGIYRRGTNLGEEGPIDPDSIKLGYKYTAWVYYRDVQYAQSELCFEDQLPCAWTPAFPFSQHNFVREGAWSDSRQMEKKGKWVWKFEGDYNLNFVWDSLVLDLHDSSGNGE